MTELESTGSVGFSTFRIGDKPTVYEITISFACPDELTSEATGDLSSALCEQERAHLLDLKTIRTQNEYLVAHILLRVTLSTLRPIMPSKWHFTRTVTGQPVICYPKNMEPLFFSLSHTKSLVACAVTSCCRVGLDVELVESNLEVTDLTPHVFSKEEFEWWQLEKPAVRLRRFYELWTLKESLLKAVGLGLKITPSRISFHQLMGISPKLIELMYLPTELGNYNEWSFRIFEPTNKHICALAVNIPPGKLLHESCRYINVEQLVSYVYGV